MAPLPLASRDPIIQAYLKPSTPNVSDALDRLGVHGAPHGIVPLWPGCPKIVGRAITMHLVRLPALKISHAAAVGNGSRCTR